MYQLGEKFGDYEIVQILGAGGMGQVYKVRNTLSDRFEAMKVLLPNLEQHAGLADRFLREIKVQAGLHHKNIAGLHTAQRHGDRILMFIEFVDGITLDKALQRGPLSPELAANIIGQVLEALAYAHSRGVVHRDIKPENIMVQTDGTVKLMDFGIARLAQDRRLTSTGRTVGSLYYMSPEQIRGTDDLDGRSDLYSLGITLYQCLTGKRPFDGDSDYSIMSAHISHVPTPPLELDPRVPSGINDVVMMAIAKDRAVRFQTADAFLAALRQSVMPETAPVITTPPPAPRTATAPISPAAASTIDMAAPPPPLPFPAMQATPPPRSGKGVWIGLASLLLLGGGGLAYVKGPVWFSGEATPVVTAEPVKPEPVKPEPAKPESAEPESAVPEPAKPEPRPVVDRKPVKPEPPQVRNGSAPKPEPKQQVSTLNTQPLQAQPSKPVDQVEPLPVPAPKADPQATREMAELRQKFNELSIRFSTAQESVRKLEAQQNRQGMGMRGDIRNAVTRFQYLMKESGESLSNRDIDAARTNLQMAERNLERVEKFLGQ